MSPEATNIPTSIFGNARQDQVVKGVTFTSEAGLLIPGTMEITPETILPTLNPKGDENDLLEGVQLIGQDGGVVTGKIPKKSASDVTVSGSTVTVPFGYYENAVARSVNTATQATPSISINTGTGQITATSVQSEGYVASGTTTATERMATQGYQEIIPSKEAQRIPANTFLTGDQVVLGYNASVEPLTVTENGTYYPADDLDGYSQVTVSVATGPNYTVDSELLADSENPIQNKAVYSAISGINSDIDDLDNIVNGQDGNSGLTKSVSDMGKSIENISNSITSLSNSIDSTISNKVQTSIAGLNVNIATYTNPSQFGSSYSATIRELHDALPDNSMFVCGASSLTDASWNLPSIYGVILMFKQISSRNILRFYGKESTIGNYQMSFDSSNHPTGAWVMDLSSVLHSSMYGTKLPGEDGKPYTHVKGRLFFLKASD